MKINHTFLLIILGVIICALGYWAFTEREGRKKSEASLKLAIAGKLITDAKAPLAGKKTDSTGVEHSTFETTGNVNKKPVAVSPGLLDTITKNLDGVKPGDVTSYELISLRVEANNLRAKVDSLQKKLTYAYTDAFLNLAYHPASTTDPNDKGSFDFGYNMQVKRVDYTKGLKIFGVPFGNQKTFTDVSSKDKRAKIESLDYLTISQNQPSVTLNVFGSARYAFYNRSFNVGPAIEFKVKKFVLQGVAYYNNDPRPFTGNFTSKFNPEIGLQYRPF